MQEGRKSKYLGYSTSNDEMLRVNGLGSIISSFIDCLWLSVVPRRRGFQSYQQNSYESAPHFRRMFQRLTLSLGILSMDLLGDIFEVYK